MGSDCRATELVATFRQYLSEVTRLTEENAITHFRNAATRQKRKLVNEYFQTRWSITRQEFLKGALAHLPQSDLSAIAEDVKRIDLDAGLIVALYVDEEPFLLEITQESSVFRHEQFVVQGSGRKVAYANMLYRNFSPWLPSEIGRYVVYESKVLSQAEPHVGPGTIMCALKPDGDVEFVTWPELATLRYQFERLGPRPLPTRWQDIPLE